MAHGESEASIIKGVKQTSRRPTHMASFLLTHEVLVCTLPENLVSFVENYIML